MIMFYFSKVENKKRKKRLEYVKKQSLNPKEKNRFYL